MPVAFAGGDHSQIRRRGVASPDRLEQRPSLDGRCRLAEGGRGGGREYSLNESNAGSTRVTLTADCHMRGAPWRLLAPLIRMAIRKADRGQLAALKQLIETGS